MKEKIQYFLERSGYKKLSSTYSGIEIFFTIENGYVNGILVGDLEGSDVLDVNEYEQIRKKTQWRFMDGGCIDVHLLSIFVTDQLQKAREISVNEPFAWFIDTQIMELVIDPGKAEDFYGLKGQIEEWIQTDYNPSLRSSLHDMVYDVNGKPYYKTILDRPVVNHGIFVVNILVFTFCILTGNILYQYGCSSYPTIVHEGEWYRLITSMFLHGDMTHITSNMVMLYYLGDLVERALGHRKYFVLYFGAGIMGNMVSLAYSNFIGEYSSSIGASGAVFGVFGALLWIAIRNHGQYDIFNVRKLLIAIGFSLFAGFTATNIDNAAHVGGFLAGFVLSMVLYRLNKNKKKK